QEGWSRRLVPKTCLAQVRIVFHKVVRREEAHTLLTWPSEPLQAWGEGGSISSMNLGSGDVHLRFPQPSPIAYSTVSSACSRNSVLASQCFGLLFRSPIMVPSRLSA
ncbi:unnamed protein product, partial [Ectocarpus sp. 12 AP-2014]